MARDHTESSDLPMPDTLGEIALKRLNSIDERCKEHGLRISALKLTLLCSLRKGNFRTSDN